MSKLSHLKTLFLWQCRLVKNEDLSWLKDMNLEVLDISYCNQLSNDCLKYLTRVQKIFLDGINYIDSDGVLELTKTSKVLKEISLVRCPEVDVSLFSDFLNQKNNNIKNESLADTSSNLKVTKKVKSNRRKAFFMMKLKNGKNHKRISKKSNIKLKLRLASGSVIAGPRK